MTAEITGHWPGELQRLIGGATVTPHQHPFNRSRAIYTVRTSRDERLFLKVSYSGENLTDDVERFRWARDTAGLTVPEVVDAGFTDQLSWLLTVELPGRTFLASLKEGAPGEDTIRRFAAGLRAVHRLPADICPFHWTIESVYTGLRNRIEAGEIRPLHRQRLEYRHLTLPDVLDSLRSTCPTDVAASPVVIHGDYSLHNVMLTPSGIVEYLDLGRMGTGDRWMDLAFAYHSVLDATGEDGCGVFFDSYGVDIDDDRLKFFSLLVDFAY